MATNYPGSLDNFVNPTASDTLNSATVPHADQHANLNDAVEAIQTELGINPSSSFLTVDARIFEAERQIADQSVLNGLTDVTIAPVVGAGDVLRYNGSQWVNDAQQNLVDGGNF
jgi:hypothetical protein